MNNPTLNWLVVLIPAIVTIGVVATRYHMTIEAKTKFFAIWIGAGIVSIPVLAVFAYIIALESDAYHVNWIVPCVIMTIFWNGFPTLLVLWWDIGKTREINRMKQQQD